MSILNSSLTMVLQDNVVCKEITITESGVYDASLEGYGGYSIVTVDIPKPPTVGMIEEEVIIGTLTTVE